MLGTIVIRALLVIALIVSAHTIKPFSIKNIAQHMVTSTRSFDFILPEGTRVGVDYVNFLALSLSNSLSEDGFINGITSAQLLAVRSQQQALTPAARIWPPDQPVKPNKKSKPPVKRSAPSKRIEKCENNSIAAVTTSENSLLVALKEIEKSFDEESGDAVSPIILPAISEEIANLHALPLSFLQAPDGSNYRNYEPKALKMVAAIVIPKKPRVTFQLVNSPKTVAPECEGQKPDSGEPESIVPELEAPEAEEPQPEVIDEKRADPEAPEANPVPLKCPTEP